MTEFDCKIAEQFNEERLTKTGDKPDPMDWAELIQTDPDLAYEFARTFDNTEVKEADEEFDPDTFDECVDMRLAIDQLGDVEAEMV